MHELGIAGSILESAQTELRNHSGARLNAIGLRIGAWSGVDPDSLKFCFEVLARDTRAAGAKLAVETCPIAWCCRRCHEEFAPVDGNPCCPECGSGDCHLVSGQQLEIAYLELEES